MWYVYAILAAMCWGVNYVFVGKLLPNMSIYTLYIVPLCLSILYLPFSNFISDLRVISTSSSNIQWYLAAVVISSILANLFLYKSFKESDNVVLSSLIEISYPLFVVFFSYLFFKEITLNVQTILGGICIIGGSVLIISNH